jgi:hypothetical protein
MKEFFEQLNLSAYRALRDIELFRGLGKAHMPASGFKSSQQSTPVNDFFARNGHIRADGL